jgi:hypothetical protein
MCVSCSNTDPVSTPKFVTATALLLRIASPLFHRWAQNLNSSPCDLGDTAKIYGAHRELRSIAERFFNARTTDLPAPLQRKLETDLDFAHDLHHEYMLTDLVKRDSQICPCSVAGQIRELQAMLSDEREAAA